MILVSVVSLAFSIGCGDESARGGLSERTEDDCDSCHGNEQNAAPPLSLDGSEASDEIGVGAHQTHLRDGKIAQAILCEECHVVPETVDDPKHLPKDRNETRAEVTFGELAKTENLDPNWDRDAARCSNVYCHGASLSGGKHVEPIWTDVDTGQTDCDGCHGEPPPTPHPQRLQRSDCASCHPNTVDKKGEIKINDGLHINGTIETATECYSCHGSEDINDAPPPALDGSEESGAVGVGAHQSHVQDGKITKGIACEQCHIVPEEVDDPNHLPEDSSDMNAEVTFGERAKTEDLEPIWDRDTARCSNVYCHGASLSGGKHVEPIWTDVDESEIDCDACHGNPPPSPHLQELKETDCASCHPGTVDESGNINTDAARHINGKIDSEIECYSCHGREGVNDAPPLALDGSVETEHIGVGAHQAHLQEGKIAKAIACEQCHVVPEQFDDPRHLPCERCHLIPEKGNTVVNLPEEWYDSSAEVTFGEMAKTENLEPTWDRESAKCSNIYCHGASLSGGRHTEPTWTRVDKSQIDCDGCHGEPPPAPHPQNLRASDCARCHPNTVDDNGDIKVSRGRHVNGEIDTETECISCHGTRDVNEAPFRSLDGSDDTEEIGVGAHQSHLREGNIAKAIECEDCHVVPETIDDSGHRSEGSNDTHAEVTFGENAKRKDLTPTWNRSEARCTNTYCHGASLSGGGNTEPIWTRVDESQIDCDSCHGYPPPPPHLQGERASTCVSCHPETVDDEGTIKVADGLHINGKIDSDTECHSCHGREGVNEAPPLSLDGFEDTADISVGAHQSHMQSSTVSRPIDCDACHVVPESVDDPGHRAENADDKYAEVVFGGLATVDDLSPIWDRESAQCTNVYCHGATLKGGVGFDPIWTQVDTGPLDCDLCHGAPPPQPHPQNIECTQCHDRTLLTDQTIDIASGTHIDGQTTF